MSLSKQEIGTIIIRVLGIYILIYACSYLGITLSAAIDAVWRAQYGELDLFALVGPLVSLPYIVIGIWFLRSAKKLGLKLVGMPEQESNTTSVSAKEWEEIIVATLGYYFLFDNLPRIVGLLSAITAYDQFNQPFPTTNLITTILMFLMSIWLILRGKGFIAIVHKLRNAGLKN